MADAVALHHLVGAVAGAIVDAQALVEQRFIQQVSGYFDSEGKPLCLAIKMPRPGSGSASGSSDEMQIGLPLLSLAESSMLAIKDLRIDLDVELGSVIDGPGAAPPAEAAADLAADPTLPVPGHSFRSNGAPIDTPAARGAPAAPAAELTLAPLPGVAAAPPLPEKQLTLSVGTATSTGPKARLSINVAAKPPSEAMQRLMTQLNKLV